MSRQTVPNSFRNCHKLAREMLSRCRRIRFFRFSTRFPIRKRSQSPFAQGLTRSTPEMPWCATTSPPSMETWREMPPAHPVSASREVNSPSALGRPAFFRSPASFPAGSSPLRRVQKSYRTMREILDIYPALFSDAASVAGTGLATAKYGRRRP